MGANESQKLRSIRCRTTYRSAYAVVILCLSLSIVASQVAAASALAFSGGVSQGPRAGKEKSRIALKLAVSPASFRFDVHGSQGFDVLVRGWSRGVRLVAARRHEAAIYLARSGRGIGGKVTANFGDVGEVAMIFHAKQRVKVKVTDPSGRCRLVQGGFVRLGYFIGRIKFRGERGFTHIAARQVKGREIPERLWRCKRPHDKSGGTKKNASGGVSLDAGASWLTKSATFRSVTVGREAISGILSLVQSGVPLALDDLPQVGVPFRAETIEERRDHHLLVIRLLVLKAEKNSFRVAADQSSALVRPPRPFTGFAEYSRCSGREWRGSLKVSLPGLLPVSLTGKKFTAKLSPGQRCTAESLGNVG